MHTWTEIKEYIEELLNDRKDDFDNETISFIRHYLKHDELEMAFEALFIEIIKLKKYSFNNTKKAKDIALILKLDKESIFDSVFWKKFEFFLATGNSNEFMHP